MAPDDAEDDDEKTVLDGDSSLENAPTHSLVPVAPSPTTEKMTVVKVNPNHARSDTLLDQPSPVAKLRRQEPLVPIPVRKKKAASAGPPAAREETAWQRLRAATERARERQRLRRTQSVVVPLPLTRWLLYAVVGLVVLFLMIQLMRWIGNPFASDAPNPETPKYRLAPSGY